MRFPRIYEEDGCCTAAECDLCGGDPGCAKYCPSGAIEFKEAIPSAMLKRKAVAEKFKDVFGEEE